MPWPIVGHSTFAFDLSTEGPEKTPGTASRLDDGSRSCNASRGSDRRRAAVPNRASSASTPTEIDAARTSRSVPNPARPRRLGDAMTVRVTRWLIRPVIGSARLPLSRMAFPSNPSFETCSDGTPRAPRARRYLLWRSSRCLCPTPIPYPVHDRFVETTKDCG